MRTFQHCSQKILKILTEVWVWAWKTLHLNQRNLSKSSQHSLLLVTVFPFQWSPTSVSWSSWKLELVETEGCINYKSMSKLPAQQQPHTLTLWPAGTPGSHTAAESRLTSRSCTNSILFPILRSPSWRLPMASKPESKRSPRTSPKLHRKCKTIKQSETALPGKTRPGIRDNSGRGWRNKSTMWEKLWIIKNQKDNIV